MNVIVSNKYAAMLSNLDIDLIKSINGEFEVDDLIAQFDNFFFKKMILDITAIKGYQDISQIQRLSFGLDMSKVILLLDDSPIVNSKEYLSELVSMGIYNFTRNIDAISFLIKNPNSYKDVAQFHILGGTGGVPSDSGAKGFHQEKDKARKNSFINMDFSMPTPTLKGTRIIGVKNLTDHAGATTLIYMLKKQLSLNYATVAIELDKHDFLFFNDEDMKSVSSKELTSVISQAQSIYDVILVDVNNVSDDSSITEMLYLMEPSTIMLNKMIKRDRNILAKVKDKEVLLNKCLLDSDDVREFEMEAGLSVFQVIPPLDDKKDRHRVLDELLNKLGFDKNRPIGDNKKSAKLFGIVKE